MSHRISNQTENIMQVTAATNTAEGQLFVLNNGDSLLMKNSSNGASFPVYVFANGRTYSARTGRFSATTIVPAMVAVRRYQA